MTKGEVHPSSDDLNEHASSNTSVPTTNRDEQAEEPIEKQTSHEKHTLEKHQVELPIEKKHHWFFDGWHGVKLKEIAASLLWIVALALSVYYIVISGLDFKEAMESPTTSIRLQEESPLPFPGK